MYLLKKNIFSKHLNNHPLIFCLNPGRSGSKFLAELFNTGEKIKAYHEPKPKMNGVYLDYINNMKLDESYDKRKIKVQALKRKLSFWNKDTIYCETTHMFIKTFYDVILDEFENVKVIRLKRDFFSILKSFV